MKSMLATSVWLTSPADGAASILCFKQRVICAQRSIVFLFERIVSQTIFVFIFPCFTNTFALGVISGSAVAALRIVLIRMLSALYFLQKVATSFAVCVQSISALFVARKFAARFGGFAFGARSHDAFLARSY
jgi:hypothetical protein